MPPGRTPTTREASYLTQRQKAQLVKDYLQYGLDHGATENGANVYSFSLEEAMIYRARWILGEDLRVMSKANCGRPDRLYCLAYGKTYNSYTPATAITFNRLAVGLQAAIAEAMRGHGRTEDEVDPAPLDAWIQEVRDA